MPSPSPASNRHFSSMEWVDASDPQRGAVEAFVRGVYRRRFDARLEALMPHLLALRNSDGRLEAVAGLRAGMEGPLFVERYLSEAVEQRLQRSNGCAVARAEVVEFGNFAACSPGVARALVLALLPWLQQAGLRWVLFVATRQLRNTFQRLGLPLLQLQQADAHHLGSEAALWGRYYDSAPAVVAGDLHAVPDAGQVRTAIDLRRLSPLGWTA